jgi:hypothetical protein
MNPDKFEMDYQVVERLVQEHRLRSAKYEYEKLIRKYPEGEALYFSGYADFMHRQVGNGKEASRLFHLAIDRCSTSSEITVKVLNEIELKSCRPTLYYFCLDYEEYFSWADHFLRLSPMDPIETENKRKAEEQRQNDRPWLDILLQNMFAAYDPFGPQGPRKGFPAIGMAASQFIIVNRDRFHFSPAERQEFMRYLHVSAMTNLNQHLEAQKRELGRIDLGELELIRASIRPLFREYVADQPRDEAVLDKSYKDWLFLPPFLNENGDVIGPKPS